MAKAKAKTPANRPEGLAPTLNERILGECHSLYVDPVHGLIQMGKLVGLQLQAPRRKMVVMLIGNHSAGKSSFINWYVGEHVQKTGVAIETQGFTFVTNGKKRESLTGKATLHLYSSFRALEKIKGVVDYISTEITASKERKFNLVTFIDTPGLVDGEMHYPYDVDKAILWLGDVADQIYVFFDPIGQALCKRTINLVEKLNAKHNERIHFFLSKADEAGTETDRQKVMMQIVQELCKRPGLNKCGFEMPTIYIPDPSLIRATRCVNQIEGVCDQIDKAINYTIQNTLNALEKDCNQLTELINTKIDDDNRKRGDNFRASIKGLVLATLAIVIPLLTLLNPGSSSVSNFLTYLVGRTAGETLQTYLYPVNFFWDTLPTQYHFHAVIGVVAFALIFLVLARLSAKLQPTLSRKEKKQLQEKRDYIHNQIKPHKHDLYKEYLSDIVMSHDFE